MRRLFVLAMVAGVALGCSSPPKPAPATPRMEATETVGLPPQQVQSMFRSAAEPIQRCAPGSSGKITVRVLRVDGALRVEAAPGASLDPVVQRCILDALSSVPLSETGSNVGGPAVPPPGFVSHVTVSW